VESAGGRTPLGRATLHTEEGRRVRLPRWAAWFSDLGAWATQLAESGKRGTVAVSVPAIGYAATLVGCGVVFAAFRPQHNSAVDGCQFESASRLPRHEHAVRLVPTEGTASFVGVLQGTVLDRERQLFHVGGSKFPTDRYRIDLLRWPDLKADLQANRNYSHPLEIPDGLDGLLPGSTTDFCGYSALHCAVVSSATRAEQEAQTLVAASSSSPAVPLGSLLRSRAVRDTGRQYRSLVLSAQDDPEEYRALVADRHPSATVLDGAAAVCRWLGARMAPVTVALVERLGASGEAAADLLESRRRRSLCDLPLPADLAEVPSGIEVLAWQDRG